MSLDSSSREENPCINTDDDDPARILLTLYLKGGVGRSYKCPIQDIQERKNLEYGYYEGNIIIENPLQVLQIQASKKLIKLLEKGSFRDRIISELLHICCHVSKTLDSN